MTDERDIRKRLRDRLRDRLSGQEPAQPEAVDEPRERTQREILFRRKLPRTAPGRPGRPPVLPDPGPPIALAEASAGQAIQTDLGLRAWLVAQRLEDMPGGWAAMGQAFASALGHETTGLHQRLAALCEGGLPRCEEMIFLDLETTGLSNLPVFLIGTMVWEEGGFFVKQYFARDYSEERAILALYADAAADKKLIVTFNGKSFDVPYLRVRAAGCGAPFACPPHHLDLLHVSRRIWGGQFEDCKLQTLERHLCGRHRTDDIPGHLIPDAYHEYVRTGNARQMAQCLNHNRLDLITLADLMVRLPAE